MDIERTLLEQKEAAILLLQKANMGLQGANVGLRKAVVDLRKSLDEKARRVEELERQLKQNSRNSSKSSSSDRKGNKPPSEKKGGAKKGHKGHFRRLVPNPAETVQCKALHCPNCRGSTLVAKGPPWKRQVYDWPENSHAQVIEYHCHRYYCKPNVPPIFAENQGVMLR